MRSTLRSNLETEEFCEIFCGNFDKRLADEERRNECLAYDRNLIHCTSRVKYTRLSERIRNKNSSIKFDRIETVLNFLINILDINEQWNVANGCRCRSNVETNLKKDRRKRK